MGLIVEAQKKLAQENIQARLVSPCPAGTCLTSQPREYGESVLLPAVKARLAVEAGVAQGWSKYVGDAGDVLAIDKYGASAPYQVLFEKYGYSVDNVVARAKQVLGRA